MELNNNEVQIVEEAMTAVAKPGIGKTLGIILLVAAAAATLVAGGALVMKFVKKAKSKGKPGKAKSTKEEPSTSK